MALNLMYITNSPAVAKIAEGCGVQRIWVDLEVLGKEERQPNMNTVKSNHTVEDVKLLSSVLTKSELLVRVNPWNPTSLQEIEDVISAGADRIMLPMWKNKKEVDAFLDAVGGRTKTTLLLETKEAAEALDTILENPKIEEVHIGLNDLHLSYGMKFMFELLADGTVERLCQKLAHRKIPYGFGGVAKPGGGMLPAENILTEHYRLGSSAVILSRSFCDFAQYDSISAFEEVFTANLRVLRDFEATLSTLTPAQFAANHETVKKCVHTILKEM